MRLLVISLIAFVVSAAAAGAYTATQKRSSILDERASNLEADTTGTGVDPSSSVGGDAGRGSATDSTASPEETGMADAEGIEPSRATAEPESPVRVPEASSGDEPPLVEPKSGPGSGETPDSAEAEAARRLAKIFSAMRARNAASVLQLLDDSEIETVLVHLSDEEAARILAEIEPRRAAALSRSVLGVAVGENP